MRDRNSFTPPSMSQIERERAYSYMQVMDSDKTNFYRKPYYLTYEENRKKAAEAKNNG